MFPTISPDGKLIAFLSAPRRGVPPKLMVMAANGTKLQQMPLGKATAISPPAWSPDSSQLAYISVRSRSDDNGLYIVDVATKRERKLEINVPIDFSYKPSFDLFDLKDTFALTDTFAPSWSPDGKELLLFGGLSGKDKTTLRVTLDGKRALPLLQATTGVVTNASWSPDGRKVLFLSLEAMGQDTVISLEIADVTGKLLTKFLFDLDALPQFPSWSPDGKQIVYTGFDIYTGMKRIHIRNADGSDVRQLTEDNFSKAYYFPLWGTIPAAQVKRK